VFTYLRLWLEVVLHYAPTEAHNVKCDLDVVISQNKCPIGTAECELNADDAFLAWWTLEYPSRNREAMTFLPSKTEWAVGDGIILACRYP
jgi:hypothetical protein